ncbi:chloride channel protein [Bradyrhizobium erythrophlei]|uniref:chloride channel protein n=1 Tax=Bradyrhizobium erythrophlei TaxID=1437360 RepID=UPI0035EFB9AE
MVSVVWARLEKKVRVARAVVRLRTLMRTHGSLLIPLAMILGLCAGVVVVIMSYISQLAHVAIYGIPIDVRLSAHSAVNPFVALVAPTVGGLVLGCMEWSRRRWKLSNATDPIEANALRGGNMSMRDSLVVSGQTLISNGCGASVGLEAGYTQIGSGMASIVGRILNLRRSDVRLMVGCGAAAAIAAAFNAPLTGAFYACELVVGVYAISSAAPIFVAALAGSMVAERLGGAPYSLGLPDVGIETLQQSFALIVLGLLAGGLGIAVMRIAAKVEQAFNRTWIPVWSRPALGGICVGAMAIYTPQVLGAGHGAMLLDLHHDMAATAIVILIVLKLAACTISLGSGFRGGLFFASLFVGSMFGKLYAIVVALPFLGLKLGLDPTTVALTGMATLGVAIVGGPLTMAFLVLEMTRSLDVAAAVLAACITTSAFVRETFGHSFSTWRLHLRGETISSARDIGWLRNLTVASMMRTDVRAVSDTMTISECRQNFRLGSSQAIFAVDGKGKYRGVVSLPEIFSSDLDSAADTTRVLELARHGSTVLLQSMDVKIAMGCFERAEADILPVVDVASSDAIVGFLTEAYARRRYMQELDRSIAGVARAL